MIDRRRHPDGMAFGRWIAADGWSVRDFRWPAERARGTLVFLGGRGDFVEKYLEALAHWQAAGWSIAGFDWRGQGGSGRMLADPLVNHLDSFDPLVGDLVDWLDGIDGPRVAVAHSMGAHLALRAVAERGVRFDAIILCAPMLGLKAGPLGTRAIAALARGATLAGRRHRRVWEGDAGNVGGRMTACADRQADKLWWKAQVPEIASGAPSWGWTRAACASLGRLTPAAYARIDAPVLMLVSARDPIVGVGAIRRAARLIPDATLHVLPGQGHELLREADGVRLDVLARIDAFLSRSASRAPASRAVPA